MALHALHEKCMRIENMKLWREKIPCSLGIVWKLASLNRHGVRADRWENGFSTHNATYRGINPTGHLITVRLKLELYKGDWLRPVPNDTVANILDKNTSPPKGNIRGHYEDADLNVQTIYLQNTI